MEAIRRKSSAVPQELESYTIKQFKNGTTTEMQAKEARKAPSVERDQEIASLRKELALLKMAKGEAVAGVKETKKVEVLERKRSPDQISKVRRLEREYAGGEGLERSRSAAQSGYDGDSQTTVITVDEGRRRRSSATTPIGRSSMDSIEQRREARYHSPRTSKDLDRRDLYLVQVTEPLPTAKKASREVRTFKKVTIYQKEARHTALN